MNELTDGTVCLLNPSREGGNGSISEIPDDIGAMWAVIVWLSAQVHFYKIRKPARAADFGHVAKTVMWLCAVSTVVLYSLMYGPSWTHAGEIKYPVFLYALVVASLILPAILLTFSLRPPAAQGVDAPDGAAR